MKLQIEDNMGNDIVIINFVNTAFDKKFVNSLDELLADEGYSVADVDNDDDDIEVIRVQNYCEEYDYQIARKELLKIIEKINNFFL